jgi:DeoR family transcriptional regulator, aga operon transcriptional repressor
VLWSGVADASGQGSEGMTEAPMLRHDRLSAVLDLLANKGALSVEQIAKAFNVSAATVRRDLDELAEQQLLARTRGGAVLQSVAYDLPLRYKTARQHDEKQRIAARAASMVSAGSVVGLNGGTTTTAVARALALRPDLATDRSPGGFAFTVVTNAINIANELAVRPHIKIVLPGGVARSQSYELIGPLATRGLEDLTLDVMFLGVDALGRRQGAAANNEGEAEVNRLMVQHAGLVVVVADASKLERRAFCKICDISSIDTLITDAGASDAAVAELRAMGMSVDTV